MNFEIEDYRNISKDMITSFQESVETLNLLQQELNNCDINDIKKLNIMRAKVDELQQEIKEKQEIMLWRSIMYCNHIVVKADDRYPNIKLKKDKPLRACIRCGLTNAYIEDYKASMLGTTVEKFNYLYLSKRKEFKIDIKDISYCKAKSLYQEIIPNYINTSKEEIIKRIIDLESERKIIRKRIK